MFSLALLIFVRSQDPNERLDVRHVPGTQISEVTANNFCKVKNAGICVPRRPRLILKVKTIFPGRDAGDVWLEEDVSVRLGNESEYRHDRPSEHSGLLSRKRSHNVAPALELRL